MRASGLGLVSPIRLDSRKDIHSVNSARPILHLEVKVRVLLPLGWNNEGRNTNTYLVFTVDFIQLFGSWVRFFLTSSLLILNKLLFLGRPLQVAKILPIILFFLKSCRFFHI